MTTPHTGSQNELNVNTNDLRDYADEISNPYAQLILDAAHQLDVARTDRNILNGLVSELAERLKTKIKTYPRVRPGSWLKDHPEERWQCDIFPADGSDHHGIGATEAEAIMNAALAYRRWEARAALKEPAQ